MATTPFMENRMTPWLEAAFAKYLWVWVGLTFGLAAKYALLIKRGVRIRGALIAADILLLPLVALIAYAGATRAGAEGEMCALFTALATVGADRLVKLYTERFLKTVEHELGEVSARVRGEVRQTVQVEESADRLRADKRRNRKEGE